MLRDRERLQTAPDLEVSLHTRRQHLGEQGFCKTTDAAAADCWKQGRDGTVPDGSRRLHLGVLEIFSPTRTHSLPAVHTSSHMVLSCANVHLNFHGNLDGNCAAGERGRQLVSPPVDLAWCLEIVPSHRLLCPISECSHMRLAGVLPGCMTTP